jgi:uncharacterized membrane protein YvbJ
MTEQRNTPEICPACGAEVPAHATACPECGADENTGWNEEAARYDGIDLPDDEFNHDEFVEKEFGPGAGNKKKRIRGWGILVVILILLILAILFHG